MSNSLYDNIPNTPAYPAAIGNVFSGSGSATPAAINYTVTGGNTPESEQAWLDAAEVDPRNYGVVMNDGTDQSAHLQSCINAVGAGGGGIIRIPPGIIYCNVVIGYGGVVIQGQESGSISPTTDYLRPFNPAKAVIQFGQDSAYVFGSGIRDLCIYDPTALGQYGVTFGGGAFKCFASNIHIIGMAGWCLGFVNDDYKPCSYNQVDRISIITGSVATTNLNCGVAFIDKHNGVWSGSVSGTTLTVTGPSGPAFQQANPGVVAPGATISAPAAWVASTNYSASAVVTNGGNVYWCATGGTAAPSGGPSGTGVGIVDGVCLWNYLGAASGALNSAVIQPYGTSGTTGTGGAGTYALSASSASWSGVFFHNGPGWTTANLISNFNIVATYQGPQIYTDSATGGALCNGYLQGAFSSQGITMTSNWAGGAGIEINNVDQDYVSYAPTGYAYVSMVYDCGTDSRVQQQWANRFAVTGQVNVGGQVMVIAGHTTGSISAGTNTLTLTSLLGGLVRPGREVQIMGAGNVVSTTAHLVHVAKIKSIAGLVATLDTNAVTTVSGVDVGIGDVQPYEVMGQPHSSLNTNEIVFPSANAAKNDCMSGMYPSLYRAGNGGNEPWDGYGMVEDLWTAARYWLQQIGTQAAGWLTGMSWNSGVVTGTSGSPHTLSAGDVVVFDNCANELGINGSFKITSAPSTTSFTYASPTAIGSGSVASPALISARIYKLLSFKSGQFVLAGGQGGGLAMRSQTDGSVKAVMYNLYNTAQFNFVCPDNAQNGFFGFTWGNNITTGTAASFGSGASNKFRMSGNGVWQFIECAAPSLSSGWGQLYADSTSHQVMVMNTAGTKTQVSLDKTLTTAGTTGAQTLNVSIGTIRIAAAGTSVVLTNSLISATSVVMCCLGTVDATAKSAAVVTAAGSCTFTLNAAATAEVAIFFWVMN